MARLIEGCLAKSKQAKGSERVGVKGLPVSSFAFDVLAFTRMIWYLPQRNESCDAKKASNMHRLRCGRVECLSAPCACRRPNICADAMACEMRQRGTAPIAERRRSLLRPAKRDRVNRCSMPVTATATPASRLGCRWESQRSNGVFLEVARQARCRLRDGITCRSPLVEELGKSSPFSRAHSPPLRSPRRRGA